MTNKETVEPEARAWAWHAFRRCRLLAGTVWEGPWKH